MDGCEAAVAGSLQYRLAVALSVLIVAIALGAGLFTFVAALDDAHEAQDKQLRQVAYLVGRMQTGPVSLAAWRRLAGIRLEERLVLRFLQDGPSPPETGPASRPHFSNTLSDGLQTVRIDDEQWRIAVLSDGRGVRIAVGQQTSARDAAARATALRSLLPFAVFAPLVLVLLALLVRQMFKPLRKLAAELRARDEHHLAPLTHAGLPSEIQPFVAEINWLLTRLDKALAHQRRFVADAAHELRSPLTAMTLQAERLAAADMPQEARRRLLDLSSGLERTRALLDQLLALARSQQGAPARPVRVSLQETIRAVIEDLFPLAEAKQIDLGVLSSHDETVWGDALELQLLVKNLVDNAIRYTPPGGQVDIGVARRAERVELSVDDSGPGIPPEEHERVFDPFYRVLGNSEPGSGLGLAIAGAVAARSGASIVLRASTARPGGLGVTVRFRPA